jgi:hypothetical protein
VKNRLALWFAGGAACLVIILAAEWLVDAPAPQVKATQAVHHEAKAGAATDEAADERDTAGWAEAINARPLFSIGRRPPKSEGGGRTMAATGLPRLAGVIISPAGRRAIFMPDGGKPMVVAEGGLLDDAKIVAIRADRVLVSSTVHGAQTLYLSYDHNRSAGGTVPPPTFANPGFNPTFPNPGFNPAVPGPPGPPIFRPQAAPPAADNAPANGAPDDPEDTNDGPEVQPVQNAVVPQLPFRNPASRGRE